MACSACLRCGRFAACFAGDGTTGLPFPGDWTWLNSNGHATSDSPMATKYFTPEFRADANYTLDYNHPEDDSLGGSTETFRSDEWQLEQASVGGDIRINNVRGRILTMDGCSPRPPAQRRQPQPRPVGSGRRLQVRLRSMGRLSLGCGPRPQRGRRHLRLLHRPVQLLQLRQLDLSAFVRFVEHALVLQRPSHPVLPDGEAEDRAVDHQRLAVVCPLQRQAGLGGQILWRPKPYLDFVFNNYGLGEDDAGYPGRSRIHADYSAQVKFYDKPKNILDKIAFTVTGDLGCEYGGGPCLIRHLRPRTSPKGLLPGDGHHRSTYNGGVNCHNSKNGRPKQMFIGWMAYNRFWFKKDLYAITLGGGQMNNPGRYLTLLPPINGATAITGTPYYTENAGDRAQMHDGTITFDYMPSQFITFRLETGYRYSDTPYWTGRGGITPPGGNNGNRHSMPAQAALPPGFGYGTSASWQAKCCGRRSDCVQLGKQPVGRQQRLHLVA
jgi:hypothetical protein